MFAQDKSNEFNKTGHCIHAVSMSNGKRHKQDQLTNLANWHSFMHMTTMPIGIAAVIRAAAEERGLSMAELAARTQLSYDSVLRKVRRQNRSISVDELQAFADALDIPASELVKRTEGKGKRSALGREATASFIDATARDRGDEASGVVLLEARHVDWDGGDAA